MNKKKYKGKIGYCSAKTLGLASGHYVYIREISDKGLCSVNIVTSLEDKQGNYDHRRLNKVKRGLIYPVPKSDATFSRWSAVNLDGNIKNVKLSDIVNIGKHKIKERHKFFVGKFTK